MDSVLNKEKDEYFGNLQKALTGPDERYKEM